MKRPELEYEWRQGFGAGFVAGLVTMLLVVLVSLALAGCKLEGAAGVKADRIANLKEASARAAAHADSVTGTAKVAKALAAADITLPQVAAYLAERGWTVRPSAPPRWHWAPAPPGTYPVAYYTWRMVGAVGDTSLIHDIPQAVGPYRLEVRAIDTHQNVGPWSIVGWSDGGNGSGALPGVQE